MNFQSSTLLYSGTPTNCPKLSRRYLLTAVSPERDSRDSDTAPEDSRTNEVSASGSRQNESATASNFSEASASAPDSSDAATDSANKRTDTADETLATSANDDENESDSGATDLSESDGSDCDGAIKEDGSDDDESSHKTAKRNLKLPSDVYKSDILDVEDRTGYTPVRLADDGTGNHRSESERSNSDVDTLAGFIVAFEAGAIRGYPTESVAAPSEIICPIGTSRHSKRRFSSRTNRRSRLGRSSKLGCSCSR